MEQVFKSSYAHILSHWGLVPKGHALDLSLGTAGMMIYSIYFLYPILRIPNKHKFFMSMATGALVICTSRVCQPCFIVFVSCLQLVPVSRATSCTC